MERGRREREREGGCVSDQESDTHASSGHITVVHA